MTDFFDKLKKGMDIENAPPQAEKPQVEKPQTEKPRVEKKPPKIKKDGKIEIKHEPILQKYTIEEKDNNVFGKDGQLTIDVFETEKDIIIQSAVAGVEPKDLDITIEKDVVSIKGKRERKFEERAKNFFYQECYWGRFSREVVLPAEVDKSKTEASIKDGVLTIKIPKK